MEIFVNGETREVAADITVARLLDELKLGDKRVAIEVNREIVPRTRHVHTPLNHGDRVEIVQAIGGG